MQNRVAVHHLFERGFIAMNGALHNTIQIRARGIRYQDLHEEPIQLGLRERISSFHFDGILRGHHQKWQLEFVGCGATGDRALLHGFKQRGLRLGRGAVDLVGEHQIREDRARLEAQGLRAMIVTLDDHAVPL